MAVDSQWSKVAILLPFEGANNQTIFSEAKRNASVLVYGNSKLSTTSPPSGCTSSAEFDGNADYLKIASPSLALGAGDWAIEFPIYWIGDTASGSSVPCMPFEMRTAEPQVAINITIPGSAQTDAKKVQVYINGLVRITSASALNTATWTWITVAKTSGTLRMFINGVVETTTYSDANTYSGTNLTIGSRFAALTGEWYGFNGRIGPLRITVGNGRGYSTTFTPPTLPYDRPKISGRIQNGTLANIARPVVVLNRSRKTFSCGAISDAATGLYTAYPEDFGEYEVRCIDELTDPYWHQIAFASRLNATGFPTLTELAGTLDYAPHVLTATGTVTASTAVADPFGGSDASALFTGAGSYLTSNDSFLPGTNYSISCWVYVTSLAAENGVWWIGTYGSDSNWTHVRILATGAVRFSTGGGSTVAEAESAAGVISINTWFHICVTRLGSNAYLFVDGAHLKTGIASGTETTGSTLILGYGRSSSANIGLTGRLYDFKYTYHPEYTTPFSRPTALSLAGPVDGGTVANAQIYDRIIPF